MRNINHALRSKLAVLSFHPVDIYFWEQFYEFIVLSYQTPFENRFSVSDLFFELKRLGISDTPEMVKLYAHGMYILAKFNNQKIYENGFNA